MAAGIREQHSRAVPQRTALRTHHRHSAAAVTEAVDRPSRQRDDRPLRIGPDDADLHFQDPRRGRDHEDAAVVRGSDGGHEGKERLRETHAIRVGIARGIAQCRHSRGLQVDCADDVVLLVSEEKSPARTEREPHRIAEPGSGTHAVSEPVEAAGSCERRHGVVGIVADLPDAAVECIRDVHVTRGVRPDG